MNYNTFFKNDTQYGQLGDESAIPCLAEYLETFMRDKPTTTEAEHALTEKLRARLLDFIASAWKEAGGNSSMTPTYFAFEEETEYIDLQTREILDENEIASKVQSQS